jgi:hypothetical protein
VATLWADIAHTDAEAGQAPLLNWDRTDRCPAADNAQVTGAASARPSSPGTARAASPVAVQRSVRDGVLRVAVHNRGDAAVNVTLGDALPWFVRLWASQAVAVVEGATASAVVSPAVDRGRAGVVEAWAVVPAGQSLRVTVPYTLGVLLLAEFPPDPNRYGRPCVCCAADRMGAQWV